VGDQLAVALAIHIDSDTAEDRQQEHPEHDRAVEPAPVRSDFVEKRLNAVRVVDNVLDGKVVGEKRVDHDGRGDRHERRDQIEGTDAAFDEAPRTATRANHRGNGRVAADNEAGEEEKRTERSHVMCPGPRPWPRTSTGTWRRRRWDPCGTLRA